MRRLENDILKKLLGEKILLGDFDNPVKVSINQFFGIEINDFAVAVAQTALWIAELQMAQETQKIIHRELNFLPLKNFANIFEIDRSVDGKMDSKNFTTNLPIYSLPSYIMGNPPFFGRRYRTAEQKKDITNFFSYKDVDYVACWYKKAAEFITNTKIQCAFVSTNSITQGEQVAPIWENLGVEINFAFRTFCWDSESSDKAHVHCVIIGFAKFSREHKIIFDGDQKIFANHINFYLDDAQNFFIRNREKTLSDVPKMINGNMAADNKNFSLTEDEKNSLLKKYPQAEKFIKNLIGGEELLHDKKKFCLWLVNANPSEIKKIPPIYERIKKVREFRLNSTFKKIADRPHTFRDLNNPKNFLAIPQVSSENREYIPIGFLDGNFIPTTQLLIIPDADLFLFGILTSSVHMAWLKTFCGRLKSDFSYSATIIYNTFPFCERDEKISQTAEKILEVRKKYLGRSVDNRSVVGSEENSTNLRTTNYQSTLADLYDPILMPKDLREAHKKNDSAVMAAYGFNKNLSESEIVAELMNLYKNLTNAE